MKKLLVIPMLLLFASPAMAVDFTITVTTEHVEAYCTAHECNADGSRPLFADKLAYYKTGIMARPKNEIRNYFEEEGGKTGRDAALVTNAAKIDGVSEKK